MQNLVPVADIGSEQTNCKHALVPAGFQELPIIGAQNG